MAASTVGGVASTAIVPCFCGSGRPPERCHEVCWLDQRLHAEQLRALAEAHDISALFPRVRPRDEVLDALAERVAVQLDADDPRVPTVLVEEGLALLRHEERERIVDDWASRYADRWQSLCAAVGDVALTRRAVVASAVRSAISERRPIPRGAFEALERRDLDDAAWRTLALVLPPPLVWDRDDAMLADWHAGAAAGHRRMEIVHDFANDRVGDEHAQRVVRLAARVAKTLPLAGLPRASRLLAHAHEQVDEDVALAREVGRYLLVAYVVGA